MSDPGGTFEADVVVDLREQGLRHAPGEVCCGGGDHHMEVRVSEKDIELIVERFGPVFTSFDDGVTEVLQVLHEQAHPDGALSWENCRERGCREAGEI
jgi:hypothetical protein